MKFKLDEVAGINPRYKKGKMPFARNRDENKSNRDASDGSGREKKQRIA